MSIVDTDNVTGPLEPEATPLSEHRLDRGIFVVADDVEVTTSPNGAPARLVQLTRGRVIHIVTHSQKEGLLLRYGGDTFYVPLDATKQVLVRQQ